MREQYDSVYSMEAGEAFLGTIREKQPPLSEGFFREYCRVVMRLNHAMENDRQWYPRSRYPAEYTKTQFTIIQKSYEEYLRNSGKTKTDVRSRMHVTSRFLLSIEAQGVEDLTNLRPPHIYDAFAQANDKGGFRKAIVHFLRYAYRYELTNDDLSVVVPSVARHTPVPSVYTPEEVETLLASIDRGGKVGKRNYAIILIAARLGLRSCDIAALKFENILFNQDIIRIEQKKTKEPLVLPLLPEVRAALVDYIEHERPASDCDFIFLKILMPHAQPMVPHSIYDIVSRAFKFAEIESRGRKRGPHALRASLATALLEEGHGYPLIQKALGQTDPNAAQHYIKIEVERLRTCALPVPEPSAEFARLLGSAVGA